MEYIRFKHLSQKQVQILTRLGFILDPYINGLYEIGVEESI